MTKNKIRDIIDTAGISLVSIALLCELVLPIWGDLIPHEIRSVITKTALTFAAIGKFVVQGNVPGLPATNPPKDPT